MNKELIDSVFLQKISDVNISEIISERKSIIGLDIGDKTVGVSVSDRRGRIATSVAVIIRKETNTDCKKLLACIRPFNPKLIIFGWPLQMNGLPSEQCEKNLGFIRSFQEFLCDVEDVALQDIAFAKWDERFSTKVVESAMIEADLSRKRRKEVVDKTAAMYILQGAIDFLNRSHDIGGGNV